MPSMTNFLELELLDHALGVASYTAPSSVFLALFTTAPSDAGGGTEVSGNGYARQETAFDVAATGATANAALETFAASGGNWGTITHFAIFDAVTTGNMLFWGALTASKVIDDGDTLEFIAGAVDITLD